MYSLKDHAIAVTEDFRKVQIVNRQDRSQVIKELPLDEGQVELVYSRAQDTIGIASPVTPFSGAFEQSFELNEKPEFGFDSLMAGGFGTADIRDVERPVIVYNLNYGQLTLEWMDHIFLMRGQVNDASLADHFAYTVYRNGDFF